MQEDLGCIFRARGENGIGVDEALAEVFEDGCRAAFSNEARKPY